MNGGNVGIGTGTAVEALQVEGNVVLSGTNRFVGTTTATGLGLRTNNLNRVFIDGNGNVGIGTNNPNTLLDLLGIFTFGQNYRSVLRTFGGNSGTGSPTAFINTGAAIYTGAVDGGGGIVLFVSTQNSNGGATGIFLYYIRKYYDNSLVWSSSASTVATIVSISGGGIPGPQSFSLTASNTLQFNFSSPVNYRCVLMDF